MAVVSLKIWNMYILMFYEKINSCRFTVNKSHLIKDEKTGVYAAAVNGETSTRS